ncbi:MAG: hypothetical protein PVF96_07875 [Candidatus Bathyarchaeota archaeon]
MKLFWDRPVIIFYKERIDEPERRAFLVVKARRLVISRDEKKEGFDGIIKDFFPLMGDAEYLSLEEGISDRYVLCWFDDEEENFDKSWRRVLGVSFPSGISLDINAMKKKTYNGVFKAEKGKLG